jgi:hypothetical protein
MDTAVGLVQAYLHINGFFTVTEYPIVARSRGGSTTLTDVDVLAMRFPGAQRWVPGGKPLPTDPVLAAAEGRLQMIIAEVKEGKAQVNRSAYSLPVVETVIRRFGCCSQDPAATARAVIQQRSADTYVGHNMPCTIQMVVFGGVVEQTAARHQVISLRHVATFLNQHLTRNRDVLLQTQIKDETLALMALLIKLGVPS